MLSDCTDSVNNGNRLPGKASFRLTALDQLDVWGKPDSVAPTTATAVGQARPRSGAGALSIRSISSPSSKSTASSSSLEAAHAGLRRQEARQKAFALRTGHRWIVNDIHTPLSLCGLGRRPGHGGEPGEVTVRVSDPDDAPRANLHGTTRCASPWSCPVCAPKLADARFAALQPQIERLMGLGYGVYLATFTVSHGPQSQFAELFKMIVKAWGRVTSGKWWQMLRASGDIQYIRGCDVTWSEGNGFHPHLHVTFLIGPGHHDHDAIAAKLLEKWMKACRSLELTVSDLGQENNRARNASWAARYAIEPAAVYEAIAMAKKRARGEGSGLTPFEILAAAIAERQARERLAASRHLDIQETAEGPWERLWRRYVSATKGLHQVSVSRGLTLKSDEMAEERPALTLAKLGPGTLRHLDRNHATAELLEVAERVVRNPIERLREIADFLTERVCQPDYCECDWEIIWPSGTPEQASAAALQEERVRRRDSEIPY